MAKGYVLYNPKAGNGEYTENIEMLEVVLNDPLEFLDVTRGVDYASLLAGMEPEDYLVITGGDGTLNRFINDTGGLALDHEVLYLPAGSGNDFARELGKNAWDDPFPVTKYLRELPWVEVQGKKYRFLNGVGYGIDGYCCQVGEELREKPGKKENYTAIAIKGLLFHYRPTRATVTVDGVAHTYEKVWLAPTMKGRFYGGGMIPAPEQDRQDPEKKVSVMVMHGTGKLKTLMIFPSIFRGAHVKYTQAVEVLTGHAVTVAFDSPRPLQIDGETVLGVTSYTVSAGIQEKAPEPAAVGV